MRALAVAAGLGAFLAGCGFRPFEPREPWRGEAEAACMRAGIVRPSSVIRPAKPIDGPGPCGADMPFKVTGFENDTGQIALALASSAGQSAQGFAKGVLNLTVLKPEATLGCPMVAWTDDWIAGSVQPAALAWFGQGVREIRTAGSYACRRRNHRQNARLSEHAFGNAIDVMSFVLNDGSVVTVKGGWRGTEQEQGFLRDVLHGACERFKTVLGPGSDALHYDHFHLDLARHDAAGRRRYCRPQVAAPQRPLPGTYGPGVMPGGPPNLYAYHQRAPMSGTPLAQHGLSQPNPPPRPPAIATVDRAALDARRREENARFDLQGGEFREDEPEFDPSAFDLTGSVADLPRPRARGGPGLSQPMPAATTPVLPAPPRAAAPAQKPPPRIGYDPAGR
ncbi:extensin family protein [Rhabdaerophilum calidifontis]|uniref:extensin-like domain-containing protein n=1 Tax=Rhabdaerophilum calidifontis TaxID=2604328 RepID=UPI00197E7E88|nr:extensin family protein [Rhabdaerophilum calidifontis]